ncbi:hypothetical protein NE237_021901 [Protea cynaroides]|uniref:Uncharacterized protein n=1 Tax=Protea cynaroides TaxID=273540 RepID=A0A9Q0HB32_9MAGN|nr:hypothetical protein NE237_021901 [Protea cynaroides]
MQKCISQAISPARNLIVSLAYLFFQTYIGVLFTCSCMPVLGFLDFEVAFGIDLSSDFIVSSTVNEKQGECRKYEYESRRSGPAVYVNASILCSFSTSPVSLERSRAHYDPCCLLVYYHLFYFILSGSGSSYKI